MNINKVLIESEQNYSVADKAEYALREVYRWLNHYFVDRKIVGVTNFPIHDILSWPDAAGRVRKWALALFGCEFDFQS